MRPGQSCPGVVAAEVLSSECVMTASMRPGQSCPGVASTAMRGLFIFRLSFNEAGAIMPRSGRGAEAPGLPPLDGFNEAGAIMPRSGSCPAGCRRQFPPCSFNEAGAIMPRSGWCNARVDRPISKASMRPGQSCPGVGRGRGRRRPREPPCFNEAGAIMPRSGRPEARKTSLRPRSFNEAGAIMPRSGVVREVEKGVLPSFASMRPGQSCPGVGNPFPLRAFIHDAASMRPGQSCPEWCFARKRSVRMEPCFNEAGAIMPRSGGSRKFREPSGNSSFNEAGAIMPRSGESAHAGVRIPPNASMRPGQSCPGVGRPRATTPISASYGFNEAGAIMPRSGAPGSTRSRKI